MGKRISIVLGALLAVMMAGVVTYYQRLGGPSYQGKKLELWLDEYYTNTVVGLNTQSPEAMAEQAAIRHIGTNAVPVLLRMAAARDSLIKQRIIARLRKQHLLTLRLHTEPEYHRMALAGFQALGPMAQPAVPQLIGFLNDTNADNRTRAARALGGIGPGAQQAVPALMQHVNDPIAIDVRYSSMVALRDIHGQPAAAVPFLAEYLQTGQRTSGAFIEAIAALGNFGEEARPAIPALLPLARDTNATIRYTALQSLKQIDSQTAASALADGPGQTR